MNGGGQPISSRADYKEKRTCGLYDNDKMLQLHKPPGEPLHRRGLREIPAEARQPRRPRPAAHDLQSQATDLGVCPGARAGRRSARDLDLLWDQLLPARRPATLQRDQRLPGRTGRQGPGLDQRDLLLRALRPGSSREDRVGGPGALHPGPGPGRDPSAPGRQEGGSSGLSQWRL